MYKREDSMDKADNNQFHTAVCIAVYEHTTLCNN